ncbi:MAG: OmpA family protein [Alphaproteobacteria bacterium]|nr:OmpA family protein [Alphaproteobacteria bacterium]
MPEDIGEIIIKKVKKSKHPHHGGAWKIAYADFVTAMMAFFLLLWLISMATPEQKKGLADYFAPPNISESQSGSGGAMAGTSPGEQGAQSGGGSTQNQAEGDKDELAKTPSGDVDQPGEASIKDSGSSIDLMFHSAAVSIEQSWQALPNITTFRDNLILEETKDGLNIQIVNQTGRAMFPEGSKYPVDEVRSALSVIGPILNRLPNQITISGHTASGGTYPNPRYGAWELSSDRANMVRSILGEFGLSSTHIRAVMGRADDEPFLPNDPYLDANERVSISVLKDAPPVPLGMKP